MSERIVESSLKAASAVTPFYAKYVVLKDRLINNEYEHWAASFSHGNNHGPGHIGRVLDKLGELLGNRALEEQKITPYELFLSMMAILYHDVGILRERKNHGDHSAAFLDIDDNDYIFDKRDKAIIRAAVVSHSSSKDIEAECSAFSAVEYIGSQTARPRVVAALVRLADELDEDFRRADPKVAQHIGISETSRFYWTFSQRILAVRPDPLTLDINFRIEFEPSDAGTVMEVDKRKRSFFSAYAEKLAKTNHERTYVGRFLPDALRYRRLIVTVRPLPDTPEWKQPRDFIFHDTTLPGEFMKAFPELSVAPFSAKLAVTLEQIRTEQLEAAFSSLRLLEEILDDLPSAIRLRTLWLTAIAFSLAANKATADEEGRKQALDSGVKYLERWHALGCAGAWSQSGQTAQQEVYTISADEDLAFLYRNRKSAIETFLGDHRSFLLHTRRGGGGGCVPADVAIEVPGGTISMGDVRVGTIILSASLVPPYEKFSTTVLRVYRSEEECVLINGRLRCTPSQPIYVGNDGWIEAGRVTSGMILQTAAGNLCKVTTVEQIPGKRQVYTLTTDHATHNFITFDLICKNKKK
jgi:hypothetical protein